METNAKVKKTDKSQTPLCLWVPFHFLQRFQMPARSIVVLCADIRATQFRHSHRQMNGKVTSSLPTGNNDDATRKSNWVKVRKCRKHLCNWKLLPHQQNFASAAKRHMFSTTIPILFRMELFADKINAAVKA